MADIENGSESFETGSRDRATVALVAAEVREVKAIIAGHAVLSAERLEAIKDQIALLSGMPERVRGLEEQGADHERRLSHLEEKRKADRDWRRVNLPTLIFAGVVALASLIGAIGALTHHL